MNGTLAPNGAGWLDIFQDNDLGGNFTERQQILKIVHALTIVHNPRATPEDRKQTYIWLEEIQRHPQAPNYGIKLASNSSYPPIIRHYALSIIEKSLKNSRYNSSAAPLTAIQDCILSVAENISENDPSYVRNKVAAVWAEHAKLRWGKDWMNMDELLCDLWARSLVHKELVAVILESLSEDIFRRDDVSASLRAFDLNRACYEIFVPLSVSLEHYKSRRHKAPDVRFGDEGWLKRLADFLDWSIPDQVLASEQCRVCTLKVYATLTSAMRWIPLQATVAARCAERLSKGLLVSNYQLQLVSVILRLSL